MKKLLLAFTFIITLSVGAYLVYYEGTLPVDKTSTDKKIFLVREGDTVNTIINNLAIDRLIRNRIIMYLVIKNLGIETKIQAGDFELSPNMDPYTIADRLTRASADVWVTIQEGLRREEIADILSKKLSNFTPSEFVSITKEYEGFLFPDTYLIPKTASAEDVAKILTGTFKTKFTAEMQAKMVKKKLTQNELVTLASLVERESLYKDDRVEMASVMLRRLSEPMPLQVDAAVQYALGYQVDQKSWWKRPLYFVDLEVDSPYNTYKNPGLPPGPIANPGINAIMAVLEADADTPYLYYVNDIYGKLHFARTLTEHEANTAKYVNIDK